MASKLLTVVFLVMCASPAWAACPVDASPDLSVCKYSSWVLSPRVAGRVYLPGSGVTWAGGSVGVHLNAWSDNVPTFGPSQGGVFVDLDILTDVANPGALGWAIKGGAHASFEGNASRSWLIPYYGGVLGMGWGGLEGLVYGEPRLGLYFLRGDRVSIDAHAGYVLPFFGFEQRAGLTSQLSVSVSFW